jgi:hypothetical protein
MAKPINAHETVTLHTAFNDGFGRGVFFGALLALGCALLLAIAFGIGYDLGKSSMRQNQPPADHTRAR